jgi:hypothetical protein
MKRLILPAAAFALLMACTGGPRPIGPDRPTSPEPGPSPVPPPSAGPEVFVGAGDIGWCGLPGAQLTAALLDGIPGTVFTAGDNSYMSGTSDEFQRCYDPHWGRHLGRTWPVPGNHDYADGKSDASAYYSYFAASAGAPAPGSGYYSFNLGAWHIVALNSEISAFPGSAQEAWLRRDLSGSQSKCTLAFFHTPVFGSGSNGSNPHMQVAWRALYEAGADVVVNAHNHSYERFAPQNPDGVMDPARGMREFVVGTGGAQLTDFPRTLPNSEVRNNTSWGVLKLTLWSDRYDWQFIPVSGQSFTDIGSGNCH